MDSMRLIDGVELKACPVCKGEALRPFCIARDVTQARWNPDKSYPKLAVNQCDHCHLVFLNPQPPYAVSGAYYGQVYGGSEDSTHGYYRDEHKEKVAQIRIDRMAGSFAPGAKILDVGAGRGHFIKAACDRGFDGWALEASQEGCEYAKQRFNLKNVIHGVLPCSDLETDFDVVTMWDVIEHMADPISALREAHKLLKPGGMLVVRTGNIGSWAFDRDRENWWAWFCDHRFYFSAATLTAAIDKAGFQTTDVSDFENFERPNKKKGRDISETSLLAGMAALVKSPTKLLKLPDYFKNKFRRKKGEKEFGESYWISIMTVTAQKPS